MRAALPARPRLHRVLAPVALVAIAAATAPAALLVLAACRQAPRSMPAATRPVVQPRPALLRVCTDPDNQSFWNARGEAFGDPPAQLVSNDRGPSLHHEWRAQRRGFVRETLGERCDAVMGVPAVDPRFPSFFWDDSVVPRLEGRAVDSRQPEKLNGDVVPLAPAGGDL